MTRFIAGIAVAVAVHLLGWPRIEAAFARAKDVTQRAYAVAASEVAK
jgi:hypothetical protein